jgi:hypothetical protein
MKKIWKWLKGSFTDTASSEYETRRIRRKFDSLKFWTPELIEWIGREDDPVRLAVASCLVNCHSWPEWLPGKPPEYDGAEYTDALFYIVEVYEMLKAKSECIAPKLYSYVWLTDYYRRGLNPPSPSTSSAQGLPVVRP